ncbi:MAG TPA: hypothetical protein VE553_05670 [Candidatus Binatia bacterium]|nr:hypothetical protein [Candidatus Binatia bacterium]
MNGELRDALQAAKSGDLDNARLILVKFLRQEPNNVPAWLLLSKLATSQVQKAAFLHKILDIDPQHTYAREALEMMGQAPSVATEAEEEPVAGGAAAPARATDETFVEGAQALETWTDESPVEELAGDELAGEEPPAAESRVEEVSIEEIFDEQGVEPFDFEESISSGDEEGEQPQPPWRMSDDSFDYEAQTEVDDSIPPWVSLEETMPEAPAVVPAPAAEEQDARVEEEEDLPAWLREKGAAGWLDEEEETLHHSWEPSAVEEAAASEKVEQLAAAMAQPTAPAIPADMDSERTWLLPALLVVAAIVFLVLVYAVVTLLL